LGLFRSCLGAFVHVHVGLGVASGLLEVRNRGLGSFKRVRFNPTSSDHGQVTLRKDLSRRFILFSRKQGLRALKGLLRIIIGVLNHPVLEPAFSREPLNLLVVTSRGYGLIVLSQERGQIDVDRLVGQRLVLVAVLVFYLQGVGHLFLSVSAHFARNLVQFG
jgi:hypothetical protein